MIEGLCNIIGHKIDRHRVWNDTVDYRTECQRCRKPLLREPDGWRVFVDTDHREHRLPHPRDRKGS